MHDLIPIFDDVYRVARTLYALLSVALMAHTVIWMPTWRTVSKAVRRAAEKRRANKR